MWLDLLRQNANSDLIVLLIGNKCDLKVLREIKKEEGYNYAERQQIAFVETSALDNTNVDVAFERIIKGKIN